MSDWANLCRTLGTSMSNLTATLQETLLQLKKVMADRRSRIEALRAEIAEIEAENETLQAAIESMLNDF